MAAQPLPSFAQTFGSPSLRITDMNNNALPPIHRRGSPLEQPRSAQATPPLPHAPSHEQRQMSRKRLHSEAVVGENGEALGQ